MPKRKRDYKAEYEKRKLKRASPISERKVKYTGKKKEGEVMLAITANNCAHSPRPEKIDSQPKPSIKMGNQINRNLKIKKLIDENPRRLKTRGWESWDIIKKDMTVAEYIDAGGHMQDLMHDVKKNNLKLTN